MTLYKTTIVIWTEEHTDFCELEDLARSATSGDAYCSYMECEEIGDPSSDEHAPDMEFFGVLEEE